MYLHRSCPAPPSLSVLSVIILWFWSQHKPLEEPINLWIFSAGLPAFSGKQEALPHARGPFWEDIWKLKSSLCRAHYDCMSNFSTISIGTFFFFYLHWRVSCILSTKAKLTGQSAAVTAARDDMHVRPLLSCQQAIVPLFLQERYFALDKEQPAVLCVSKPSGNWWNLKKEEVWTFL